MFTPLVNAIRTLLWVGLVHWRCMQKCLTVVDVLVQCNAVLFMGFPLLEAKQPKRSSCCQ